MSKIGLKIEPETYERLKWLKTRFDFVYETNMTWDELFQAIVKDSLLILAQDLKNLRNGEITVNEILSLLSGSDQSINEELKSHMAKSGLISRSDFSTQ
ncbi:MAG: hypothetical protein M1592_02490 [Candidatus Thermoplasmatota archaeon]|jgi:hypothetical protein|nr:hypothetical protein [Candidatus Thermoplasmatota archaeon]